MINKSDILTDSFGRRHTYLRISLTERCNLRCLYCMPKEGVELTPKKYLMQSNEIIYLAKLFVKYGVNKIRLTGGEPLIRKDLIKFITYAKEAGILDIYMSTNGSLLTEKVSRQLVNSGLTRLQVSLDASTKETFQDDSFERSTRPENN